MFIARDGIVDPERYRRAKVKTAFLLKEVNYPDMEEDWPYTDWLYEQAMERKRDGGPWTESKDFHKTFANVCRWLACVEDPEITYLECEDFKRHKQLLAQAAVININKGGGGSSSDWSAIAQAAERNKATLQKQFEEIKADLVICGGTFWFAEHVIYPDVETKRLPCGARYLTVGTSIFVEFVHPAWFSVDRGILFAYFQAVYRDLRPILDCAGKKSAPMEEET